MKLTKGIVPAALAALLLGGLAAPAAADPGKESAETAERPDYDWVFVYYMAYDNNLEACGRPIIDMLKEGITSDRVAVLVSADFRDTEGMQRFVLTQGKEEKTQLSEEGSAEEEVLAAELKWASTFRARKYALVFLNHGGKLGEMSHDEHPGKAGGQNWLYPPDVAKVIADWRKQVGAASGEVELMFYQQCGKGTLENYHAMQDAARWVMGSQTVVGAPNYYYAPSIKFACENPQADGLALAKQITADETPDMFTTYTTMSSDALKALPGKVDEVIAPLLARETLTLPSGRSLRPCFNFPPDELMFDGLALLEALYAANDLDRAPLLAFATWSKETLIVSHRVSPQRERRAGSWCGYSIYFPGREAALTRYSSTYPIYQLTKLDELWAKLLDAAEQAREERAKEKASKK